jgi:hypothetical protein
MARKITGWNAVEPTIMAGPDALKSIVNAWRNRTFMSCWTAQANESHALWRIYCGPTEGVAIQTTLARLRESTNGCGVHSVIYRDPELRPVDRNNLALTELAIEKRPMFEYEHEVRIIHKTPGPSPDGGYPLAWDPETAVENIYVHPEADDSFIATVRVTVAQFGPTLKDRVRWSEMKRQPPC